MPNLSIAELSDASSDASDLHHSPSKVEDDVDAKEQLNGELEDEVEETSGRTIGRGESLDDEDDEDSAAAEDEFVVEAIRTHEFRGRPRLLRYRIKWKGYPEEQNTWEPEDNLLPDARDILGAYHHKIGGAPQPANSAKKQKSSTNLKRDADESTSTPEPKKSKRNGSITPYIPKQKNWDTLDIKCETIEREETKLYAFIVFDNGSRTKVGLDVAYKHCPQTMLRFYEDHLKFK